MKPINLVVIILITLVSIVNTSKLLAQWYAQNPNPFEYLLLDLEFVDDQHGWAVGQYGNILKTNNGGVSWEEINVEIAGNSPDLSAISFLDQDTGLIGTSDGMILKTMNGGFDWQVLRESEGGHIAHLYYYGDVAYATGGVDGEDQIFRMNGDENVWELIDIGTEQPYTLNDFYFINETTGWFCFQEYLGLGSSYGAIYRTTDGLENWDTIAFEWNGWFRAQFIDEEKGWISGHWDDDPNGIYTTFDSGITWNLSFEMSAWELCFLSMDLGWITSNKTIFGYSQNAWSEQYNSDYTLRGIKFVDENKKVGAWVTKLQMVVFIIVKFYIQKMEEGSILI